jgi:thiol-disulfide isomerase/thioredoxin
MKYYSIIFLLFINFAIGQSKLPNLSINNLSNQKIKLNETYSEDDKIYVFSFWATWCAPCIEELNALNEVYDDWKKDLNIEIIAVSTDDSRTQKRVKPLLNGKGWAFDVLLDTNQDLKRALGIINIPYTIVVKNGEILHIQNGFTPGSEEELYTKLQSL